MVKSPALTERKNLSMESHSAIIATGKEAPDFSLENLNEEKFSLSDYKDKKMVALYFWSITIPLCVETLGELQKFHDKYREKVEVMTVNIGDLRLELDKFLKNKDYTFNILSDRQGVTAMKYQISEPTFILVDKKGNVIYIHRQNEISGKFNIILEKEVIPLVK
jgi:peroxiredoxin